MPRNHRQHHKNEVNPTIEIGSIELSFTEELTFFVQFFCYLIMLYSLSYLQSLYRFLRGQLGQLVTMVNNNNNRPLPPRPANRRRLRQVAPVAPAADPTADGAAIWRLSPISCSPSVSSCKTTTTTTTTTQSSTTLDLPSQQTTNPQPQQTASVSPDESIQSKTLVETFGLAFRLSHLF